MTGERPNLLFVFADQWRRQAAGCMRADPVITPHIDRFADQGTVLENAVACNPICTPNRSAMFTGKHPFSTGMMRNWLRLPVGEATLGKAAEAHGYDTGYVGKWHLDEWDGDPARGDARNALTPAGPRRMGFRFWHANGCDHRHFAWRYFTTDDRMIDGEGPQMDHETDVAIEYLRNANGERDAAKPFCLALSWSPPHDLHGGPRYVPGVGGRQYAAPERFEALYRRPDLPMRANAQRDLYRMHAPGYFGAVTWMDENFGRLMAELDELGLAEDTIVVLTADHGELLGSHRCMIKDIWYEESIGVPFIVRWPGRIAAGARERMLLSAPDITPTLLAMMGCAAPAGRHGEDLSAALFGRVASPSRSVFLSFDGAEPYGLARWDCFNDEGVNRAWRGVRTERFTYVALARQKYGSPERFRQPLPEGAREVLYDLENDPLQVNPIYRGQDAGQRMDRGERYDAVFDELHARLRTWLEGLGDPFLARQWV
jgi:arylsulfatase A-like enzyme